jgi:peptidoglycan/LPS O-acetylase OafA/YrhL
MTTSKVLHPKRVFGLDILRAVAILSVVLMHMYFNYVNYYVPSLKSHVISHVIAPMGVTGVEIFFVLSGFLIGNILIKDAVGGLTGASVKRFYLRRWFRTLPLYYLVLFLKVFYESQPFPWTTIFFLQNYFPNDLAYHPVSWSLTIEEWFYICLPWVILASQRWQKGKHLLPILIGLIVASTAGRLLLAAVYGFNYEWLHRFFPLRYDVLLLGVVLAYFKTHLKPCFAWLSRPQVFWLGWGLFNATYLGFILAHQLPAAMSDFVMVAGLSPLGVGIALMVPYMATGAWINTKMVSVKWLSEPIYRISLYSYSMYLGHGIFLHLIQPTPAPWELVLRCVACVLGTFTLSALMYHFFEKPMMDLRDKVKIA